MSDFRRAQRVTRRNFMISTTAKVQKGLEIVDVKLLEFRTRSLSLPRRCVYTCTIDKSRATIEAFAPSMTYFYSGDDLRHRHQFHSRFLFHCRAGRRRRKFSFRDGGVCKLPRRFHTSRAPRNANKQVSEPVSQTSKHVVAVSCRLVGAEVTRISRREFNSVDVG